jgi:hypothetical protein
MTKFSIQAPRMNQVILQRIKSKLEVMEQLGTTWSVKHKSKLWLIPQPSQAWDVNLKGKHSTLT